MRLTTLIPLAAVTAALVIPDESITERILVEQGESKPVFDKLPPKDILVLLTDETSNDPVFVGNGLDRAFDAAPDADQETKASFECHSSMTAFDAQAWLDSATTFLEEVDIFESSDKPHHPPHHRPHHPPHGKPDKTIYELINNCKYTTTFARLINEFDDIVSILNSTTANHTVFAPSDAAFKKLPKHDKPSKDLIKKVLSYHISSGYYPVPRILASHTIPSDLKEESIGGNQQRLRVSPGLKGLAINFYSRVIAHNIFGTNGVVHGVNSLLLPPPPARKIIELLPGHFSTFSLAISKTGIFDDNPDVFKHGGTFFAPSNMAFKKLGPRINAYLFSKRGEKCLKGLLKYHFVAGQILYSDAYYSPTDAMDVVDDNSETKIPNGHFHINLPTLLDGKSLSIDLARFGGFIRIKINGHVSVVVQDGIAKDGVIHVVNNVLIPPKHVDGPAYGGEDLTIEELVERLEGFIDDSPGL